MPMSTKTSASRVRSTYEFIKTHRDQYSVQSMCCVLGVAPSGYYKYLKQPLSNRAQEDARLLRLIRASFIASHGIYGAPRVFLDLREAGETCSKHRVARLMREADLRALHGYRTRRWAVGKPSVLIPNLLQRQFTATRPNTAWVTDITYIRTWQGWLYLAVVMDLFSRLIVGWAAGPTIHRELVLNAVLMAVRRRRARGTLIHSDQGTQYGCDTWRRFCRSNHLEPFRNGDSGSIPVSVNRALTTRDSRGKVSSERPGHEAAYAVDNAGGTWWEPAEGDAQPSLTLDLSAGNEFDPLQLFTVDSSRILFLASGGGVGPGGAGSATPATTGPVANQYTIETSIDGSSFTKILDKTGNHVTKYIEFDELPPTRCRYVRLTMTGWPRRPNARFGIIEFTVFGTPIEASGPPKARGTEQ
jgi:putative transposase